MRARVVAPHLAALAFAGVICAASPSAAQGNYRSSPIGGRTTLMGGAGLVYGSDGAAAFLNPATVQRIDQDRLTFSVNFYSLSVVHAPAWYQPGPVDTASFGALPADDVTLTDASLDVLPSSLCLFFRMSDIPVLARAASHARRARGARLGLCLATVQGHAFNFAAGHYQNVTAAGIQRQGQTVTQSFTRFSAGPTYAMSIDDHLSVGASIHASLASFRSLYSVAATTHRTATLPVSSGFYSAARGTSFNIDAVAGVTYRLGSQTVALAVGLPSTHLYGVGGANQEAHFEGLRSGSSSTFADGNFSARTPWRVGIGTGMQASWGSAEVNFTYHAPLANAYRAELEGDVADVAPDDGRVITRRTAVTLAADARPVVNMSCGAEVFVTPGISILGGVATDASVIRKGGRGPLVPTRSDRVSASAGIGSHGEGGDFLVGGEFSYAWGDIAAVNSYQLPPALAMTPQETYRVVLVIAGSTNLGSIRRAVHDVKEVLDPNRVR